MSIFQTIFEQIRRVISRMIPTKSIETAVHLESPLTKDMQDALARWQEMYMNKAPWLSDVNVRSLNLPAFISSEIARQIVLELKWNITGKAVREGEEPPDNPRAQYLRAEFEKCIREIRGKLEQGCAAGGMVIKPYPNLKEGHIYFDYCMDWGFYPISFDDDHRLQDVIFRDTMCIGRKFYTRLERHQRDGHNVKITQRAFVSESADMLGTETNLSDVPQWASVAPEATLTDTDGQVFGWFRVATANNVDVEGPMGMSVFARAEEAIRQADMQYSRLIWEYKGSELAIHVTPDAFRARDDGRGGKTVANLDDRLYRKLDTGDENLYDVFAPNIRDAALINGLNQLYMQIEDQCGLARGTISNANNEARTATELKILRDRTYTTISENQHALETCLRDVVRAMDRYCDLYHLAPAGEWELSFEWDDSIITDSSVQMQERMELYAQRMISRAEMRAWYFGETKAQAMAAIQAIDEELAQQNAEMMLQQQRIANGGATEEEERIPGQDEAEEPET